MSKFIKLTYPRNATKHLASLGNIKNCYVNPKYITEIRVVDGLTEIYFSGDDGLSAMETPEEIFKLIGELE